MRGAAQACLFNSLFIKTRPTLIRLHGLVHRQSLHSAPLRQYIKHIRFVFRLGRETRSTSLLVDLLYTLKLRSVTFDYVVWGITSEPLRAAIIAKLHDEYTEAAFLLHLKGCDFHDYGNCSATAIACENCILLSWIDDTEAVTDDRIPRMPDPHLYLDHSIQTYII